MAASKLLKLDLWMAGCYLWSIEPGTQRFFDRKLADAGVTSRTVNDSLSECLCTVVGGANAYLDKYCQFEVIAKERGTIEPMMIAFSYDQDREERNYEFYFLHASLEQIPGSEEKSILKACLTALPQQHSIRVRDDVQADKVLRSVR